MSGSTPTTLRQVLNEAVHTVAPDTSLADVLRRMSEKRVSCLVVVDAGRPVGIFTEHDSVDLMARGERHGELPIRQFMREPVLATRLSMDHHRAYQLMAARNARHLVVADGEGRLLGLVTEGDLLKSIGMEQLVQPKTVADAMTREVVTLQEGDSLSRAARLMAERVLSCIVVAKGALPVGVLSERDVVRLFRETLDPDGVRLEQVMSQPLRTVRAGELLAIAMARMETDHIRRLVVVDEKSNLVGLLTRHDIVKTLQEQYVDMLQDTIERLERDLHITRDRLESVEHRLLQRSVMDQVNDAVLVVELDGGRVVEANEAAQEILDLGREELLARRCHEFAELFPGQESWGEWVEALATRGVRLEETRFRRGDGAWIQVEVGLRHVRGEGRAFMVAVARDGFAVGDRICQIWRRHRPPLVPAEEVHAVIMIRSALFFVLLQVWTISLGILYLPLLLAGERVVGAAASFWVRGVFVLLRLTCGLSWEVRGQVPVGAALVCVLMAMLLILLAGVLLITYLPWLTTALVGK